MSDFYTYLGIPTNASPAAIQRAYRRRAKELHPDINKSPNAEAEFKALQHAFEVLMDPARRRDYDRSRDPVYGRTAGPRPSPPGPPGGSRGKSEPTQPPQGPRPTTTDANDSTLLGILILVLIVGGLWVAAVVSFRPTPRSTDQATSQVNPFEQDVQLDQPPLQPVPLESDLAAGGDLVMRDYYTYDGQSDLRAGAPSNADTVSNDKQHYGTIIRSTAGTRKEVIRSDTAAGVVSDSGHEESRASMRFTFVVPRPDPGETNVTFVAQVPYLMSDKQLMITIYSAAGRNMRVLLDTTGVVGALEVTWDGTDEEGRPVPPSMYFARARLGGMEILRKVVRGR